MNTIKYFVDMGYAVGLCLALIYDITLYVNLCLTFHKLLW